MAILASGREAGRLVIGNSVVVGALVAGVAVYRDILVTCGVARDALQRNMRPRQRELCVGVVEQSAPPT